MLRTLQRLKKLLRWIVESVKMPRSKNQSNDDDGSIWDFVAGAIIGFIGYTILSGFVKPKSECPNCGKKIVSGVSECPHCGILLEWK
jgi:zinc ribbon protein